MSHIENIVCIVSVKTSIESCPKVSLLQVLKHESANLHIIFPQIIMQHRRIVLMCRSITSYIPPPEVLLSSAGL